MGSAVAGLRAKDKSKSDIDASAHVMRNPYITVEKNVDTIAPATLVGLKIRIDGKDDLVRMNPCQPLACDFCDFVILYDFFVNSRKMYE